MGETMKWGYFMMILSLSSLILLSGCTNPADDSTPEMPTGQASLPDSNPAPPAPQEVKVVEKGDTVKVHYLGTLPGGEIFDGSVDVAHNILRDPLEFEAGAGQMIPGFDAAVLGMKEGEEKTVTLSPEQAYGEKDESRIVSFPRAEIEAQGITPEVGLKLYASGMAVTILEVGDENVTLDFNHDLAGKTLVFWIKVVEIIKAE